MEEPIILAQYLFVFSIKSTYQVAVPGTNKTKDWALVHEREFFVF